MMKKEALERQSTSYLIKLENWELIRWRRRLELLNETTYDLWSIREVLKERESNPIFLKAKMNMGHGVILKPIRDHAGTMTIAYRKHLLNDSY